MRRRFACCQRGLWMEFVVIARAIESPSVPPQAAVSLAKQTYQQFASNQDSRIKAKYPSAGARAGLLIVDEKSCDELQDLLQSMQFAGITNKEILATGTLQRS